MRTDSHGVVYVVANQFAVGMPGQGSHILIKSFDGGATWTRPQNIGLAVDTCFLVQFDGTSFRCVMDGIGGARDDLSASPSIDIANGAPTGDGATNEIVRTWVDGRDGALTLSIHDDGVGGADPGRGSGIIGLQDRVEALGGTISLLSPPGHGTTLHLQLPTGPSAAPTRPRATP